MYYKYNIILNKIHEPITINRAHNFNYLCKNNVNDVIEFNYTQKKL